MAKKPTVTTISSGYASTTTLNSNFEALRDGFDNTLSLDGSTPNAMGADLDMDGNDILNAGSIIVGGSDYLAQAKAARDAAQTAQTAAETAETAANISEASAATSATSASTSASNAATSASQAASSAVSASGSATAAAASAVTAESAEVGAETAEANAAASETASATSETNAATSETNAATSASTAATKASEAVTSAANAATSATNAASSASSASTSASNAATSASNASTSETNAATSASTATTKASEAATSESNAATSETNAASSASAASTSASNAATSATNAASSASSAASSASSAQASKDAALAALDSFDDRYLGQKASDPTLDNDGDALVAGALYFNTTDDVMKVYEGSAWVAAYASLSGALLSANNLSDLDSVSAARTNLGLATVATTGAYSDLTGTPSLGTAAAADTSDFATAAQGALAATSVQTDSPASLDSASFDVASVSGTSFNLDPQAAQCFVQQQMTANTSFTIGNPVNTSQEVIFITNNGADVPSTDGSDANVTLLSSTEPAFFSSIITSTYTRVSMCFNNDGSKVYIINDNTAVIYQYSLSTAYDLTTATSDSKSKALESGTKGSRWNADGTILYYVKSDPYIYYRTATTAYDVSTLGVSSDFSAPSQPSSTTGITFNDDGTKMVLVGSGNTFYYYNLSTAYNASTGSFQGDVSTFTNSINSLDWSPDGHWLIAGRFGNFYGWYMSTANDPSTISGLTQNTTYQEFGGNGVYGVGYNRNSPRLIATAGYNQSTGVSANDSLAFGAPFALTTSETLTGDIQSKPYGQVVNRLLTTDSGTSWRVI